MVITFPLLVCISLLYGSMHHYVTAYNCRLCFKKWEKSHLLNCYNVLQILMHVVIRFCIMKNYFNNLSIVLEDGYLDSNYCLVADCQLELQQ
jgi:hypothetical protein